MRWIGRRECAGCAQAAGTTPSSRYDGVFYFFEKDAEFLRCEIYETDVKGTFAISITEPSGECRTHYVTGSDAAHRRWVELERDITGSGWWGPHGRE